MNNIVGGIRIILGTAAVVIFLTGISASSPFEEWNRTFGGNREDWASSVIETPDGGYVFVGGTSRQSDGRALTSLIRIDAGGIQQWNKTLGGTMSSWANSVRQTGDGGFIIAGGAERDGPGGVYKAASLIKTDANGEQQWQRIFVSPRNDVLGENAAKSVQQTSDGGYVIVGTSFYSSITSEKGHGDEHNAWLTRTDANGSYMWSTIFPDHTDANSVLQTGEGFIVAGKIEVRENKTAENQGFLAKIDYTGTLKWLKKFGDLRGDSAFYSIQQTSDKGYIMAGATKSYFGSFDVFLVRTDANGSELWQKKYGGSWDDRANSVVETRDMGYALAGWTSYETNSCDAWIIKIDANGSEQWSKTMGVANISDESSSIIQTSKGDYVIAGKTRSYGGSQDADAWIIKLSTDVPVNQTSSSMDQIISVDQTTSPEASVKASEAIPSSVSSMPAPAPTDAKAAPGLTSTLSIAVVLAIAYLIRRNDC